MAEYIEREAVLERVKYAVVTSSSAVEREDVDAWCKGAEDALEQACEAVRDIPAADVVEVVRCKDCKHFFYESECSRHSRSGSPITGYTFYTRPNDFCSYGERRDNTSDMETWSPEGQKLYDTLLARVKMDGGAE